MSINPSILSHLDDYQDIFGSLNYLECEPCQSIFSPAAYFVNLMWLVEKYITEPNKNNKDFISLDTRRPDLQNIALDCDHTNNPIFYTQVVNKVLEKIIKEVFSKSYLELKKITPKEYDKAFSKLEQQKKANLINKGYPPKEIFSKETLEEIIKSINIYKHFATAKYPHNLPFNLYLEQIRLYLSHLNTSLADIYQTLCVQKPNDKPNHDTIWAREYLGLSLEEYNLITTARTEDLSDRYGVNVSTNLDGLTNKETFLKQTGLSWQELNDLLYQNLSEDEKKNNVASQFYINKLKSQENSPLKLDNGTIQNLDNNRLDRVDRFLRLSRKVGWSFADLDWVLTSIQATDIKEEAIKNEEEIKNIAKIKLLQAKTKLPLDVLCSFWHNMKTIGKGNNPNRPQNLFDRVFNNPWILNNKNDVYDPQNPTNWNINEVASENSKFGTSRLLAALQISDEELMKIVKEFWNDEKTIELKLDIANLSKLFRISQILKLFNLKVDEFKLILQFLPHPISIASFQKLKICQLIEIIELTEWLKVSGFSLYELDYIINGKIHPSVKVFLPEEKMPSFMESLWQKFNCSTEWKLSNDKKRTITSAGADVPNLKKDYDLETDKEVNTPEELVKKLQSANIFIAKTKLSQQDLHDLLYRDLSEQEIQSGEAHKFYINQLLLDKKYVQLNADNIDNLNLSTLDRIYRFLLLAHELGWSFAELEWMLTFIPVKDSSKDRIDDAIEEIVEIKNLQEQTKLSIASMINIWSDTKTSDKNQNNVNLFIQIIQKNQFGQELAIHFGIEEGLFSILAELAAQISENYSKANYFQLLLTKVKIEKSRNWQRIINFLKLISRITLLVNKLKLAEEEVRNICNYYQSYNIQVLENIKNTLKLFEDVINVEQKLGKINSNDIEQIRIKVKTITKLQRTESNPDYYKKFLTKFVTMSLEDIKSLYIFKIQLSPLNKFDRGLIKYFENPSVKALATFTGWEEEQINKALSTKYLNDKELYKKVEGLLKLKQCFDLCATIGCDIDVLCELCDLLQNEPAETHWDDYQKAANSAIAFVKAKYNHEEWEKVAGKLNGTLEERKCQILTNFALWKLGMENPRQLSEYLLLDVEMTSCACNSEIQLGILSVQTYLQRCRIGIEPGVTTVNIPDVWWEWIMNYRKWEANRKVFLYPENYIDPSLRKNASPIFKELQDELLQSEITSETVEAAYRNYFDKFSELARLQIVDSCHYSVQTPKSPDPIDTLFIFAKTITQPHTFYYRRCENPTADKPSWGYWEKIDLQINSDYLAPVYAFNRLFVFWVEIKEIKKPEETDGKIDPNLKKKITQATITIKYSFLNASQKWVSPQNSVVDVEIPNSFWTDNKTFWQQVYPVIVPDFYHHSGLIATVFGGLQTISSSNFDDKVIKFFDIRSRDIFKKKNEDFAPTIIASDLLASTPNLLAGSWHLWKDKSSITLSKDEVRGSSAATTVGNLAIFAGGLGHQINSRPSNYLDRVDVFEYKDGKLSKVKHQLTLSEARASLAATTVGNLAIFAGGAAGMTTFNQVDVFEYKDGKLSKVKHQLTLSEARASLAATTVGNLAIFAGGETSSTSSNKVDVFEYKDGNLSKVEYQLTLSEAGGKLAATTVGNLAIFAGGLQNRPHSNKVDVFEYENSQLLKVEHQLTLSNKCYSLVATTVGNLAIFVGGVKEIGFVENVDIFYSLNPTFSPLPPIVKSQTDTTITPIKNQSQGFVLQHRSEAFATLFGQVSNLTRLTTSAIQKFSYTLFAEGLDGLLSLKSQQISELHFPLVSKNQLDFDGAYGTYFWEIFFHIPFLIASTLNAHQSYNEARKWYQYIFNPSTLDSKKGKERFWHFLPFREHTLREHTLKELKDILNNKAAIQAYKENPFDPHAIARLRIGAYEKAVVMKYIDNILNWADALFTQDSWESISQATTLYLLAYDLLGSKPKNLGKPPASKPTTFAELKGKITDFLVDEGNNSEYQEFIKQFGVSIPFNAIDAYFCVSENQQFAQYWDLVEDRLFKIRHCQNIKGIERQLALFQPPLDPMQLVRQVAAGENAITLSTTTEIPHYRFSHLLERAKGMASTVIQLGSTLLNTLEKKDAEELSLLRATQEPVLLQLITRTKKKQIEEAQASLTSLQQSLAAASDRSQYYQSLIDGKPNSGKLTTGEAVMNVAGAITGGLTGGLLPIALSAMDDLASINALGLNARESSSIELMRAALYPQIAANGIRGTAAIAYSLPSIFGVASGGMQFGDAVNMGAATLDSVAGILNQGASLASTVAQFQRRKEDWELQQKMAKWDVKQIEEQIKAAQVREEMAKAELDIHHKSIEQSRQVEEFFKDKFTNKELYQWMVSRLSSLYFQTYKIALEMAYSTQKAYQYELNKDDSYLQPTYWDSNKKGLLAGESLMLGLNQLEKAYLDGSYRRLEIEKIISLRQLDPQALLLLKNTGKCKFELDEKVFALDFPSHYCRQFKTVSVSIPAVVGPYQNINATLKQTGNKVLIKSEPDAVKWLLTGEGNLPDSGTLRQDLRNNQQIAISKGVNDNGLFVLNFQDDRYLPFEGTGVISNWELEISKASNPINFDSITDVIITLSYTALEGGSTISNAVANNFKKFTGQCVLNLERDFPNAWHQFMNPSSDLKAQTLSFVVSPTLFRRNLENYKISKISIYLRRSTDVTTEELNSLIIRIPENNDNLEVVMLEKIIDGVLFVKLTSRNISINSEQSWSLSGFSNPQKVIGIALVIDYEGEIKWSETRPS